MRTSEQRTRARYQEALATFAAAELRERTEAIPGVGDATRVMETVPPPPLRELERRTLAATHGYLEDLLGLPQLPHSHPLRDVNPWVEGASPPPASKSPTRDPYATGNAADVLTLPNCTLPATMPSLPDWMQPDWTPSWPPEYLDGEETQPLGPRRRRHRGGGAASSAAYRAVASPTDSGIHGWATTSTPDDLLSRAAYGDPSSSGLPPYDGEVGLATRSPDSGEPVTGAVTVSTFAHEIQTLGKAETYALEDAEFENKRALAAGQEPSDDAHHRASAAAARTSQIDRLYDVICESCACAPGAPTLRPGSSCGSSRPGSSQDHPSSSRPGSAAAALGVARATGAPSPGPAVDEAEEQRSDGWGPRGGDLLHSMRFNVFVRAALKGCPQLGFLRDAGTMLLFLVDEVTRMVWTSDPPSRTWLTDLFVQAGLKLSRGDPGDGTLAANIGNVTTAVSRLVESGVDVEGGLPKVDRAMFHVVASRMEATVDRFQATDDGAQIRQLYDLIDANGDGCLEKQEIVDALTGNAFIRACLARSSSFGFLQEMNNWRNVFLDMPNVAGSGAELKERISGAVVTGDGLEGAPLGLTFDDFFTFAFCSSQLRQSEGNKQDPAEWARYEAEALLSQPGNARNLELAFTAIVGGCVTLLEQTEAEGGSAAPSIRTMSVATAAFLRVGTAAEHGVLRITLASLCPFLSPLLPVRASSTFQSASQVRAAESGKKWFDVMFGGVQKARMARRIRETETRRERREYRKRVYEREGKVPPLAKRRAHQRNVRGRLLPKGKPRPTKTRRAHHKSATRVDFELFRHVAALALEHALTQAKTARDRKRRQREQADLKQHQSEDEERAEFAATARRRFYLERLREVFDLIDADGGGTLDQREFLDAVKDPELVEAMVTAIPALQNLLHPPERWFKAFMDLPTNQEGHISFRGWIAFCDGADQKRVEAEAEEGEKRTQQKLRFVVRRWQNQRLATIWDTLVENIDMKRGMRVLGARVLKRWTSQTLCRLFDRWETNVTAKVEKRSKTGGRWREEGARAKKAAEEAARQQALKEAEEAALDAAAAAKAERILTVHEGHIQIKSNADLALEDASSATLREARWQREVRHLASSRLADAIRPFKVGSNICVRVAPRVGAGRQCNFRWETVAHNDTKEHAMFRFAQIVEAEEGRTGPPEGPCWSRIAVEDHASMYVGEPSGAVKVVFYEFLRELGEDSPGLLYRLELDEERYVAIEDLIKPFYFKLPPMRKRNETDDVKVTGLREYVHVSTEELEHAPVHQLRFVISKSLQRQAAAECTTHPF